jgi:tetratricopeptide (TPR) repeat protein
MNLRLVTLLIALTGLAPLGTACTSTPKEAAVSHHERALTLTRQGRTDAAMAALGEALEVDDGFLDARFDLARLQFEAGVRHHRVALDHQREARRLNDNNRPSEARSRGRIGDNARLQAEPYFLSAKDNLHEVLDARGDGHPDAAWLYHLLARCYIFEEDLPAAQENLETALELAQPAGMVRQDIEAGIRLLERASNNWNYR